MLQFNQPKGDTGDADKGKTPSATGSKPFDGVTGNPDENPSLEGAYAVQSEETGQPFDGVTGRRPGGLFKVPRPAPAHDDPPASLDLPQILPPLPDPAPTPAPAPDAASTPVNVSGPSSGAAPAPTGEVFLIEWKGSPNFWSGRDGQKPIAICNHIMEGSMESSNGWFKNRRSDASSHFGVARDGRIWQWVRVEDAAWTNGIMQNPDTAVGWLAECASRDINPNNRTISIEHEGYHGKPLTEKQYQASLWLHRYLCTVYNIAPDRQHVVGHNQITARDRANCPGAAFPWARLMTDLATYQGQPPATGVDATPLHQWTEGVAGVVLVQFGPGTVNSNNAYVRKRPSLTGQDNTLLRTFSRGKVLNFSAYTEAGPAFQGSTRWYLIAEIEGGGWIHSAMITGAR